MSKFISNAAGYNDTVPPSQQTFADVPSSNTFWLFVERAYLHKVISGYNGDGVTTNPCTGGVEQVGQHYFRWCANVTRGQTAKFVSQAARYSDVIPPGQQTFTDVPYTNTFWVYVERVVLHGVVSGYNTSPPCTTGTPCFLGNNKVTRGQTAKFISNAFFPACVTP